MEAIKHLWVPCTCGCRQWVLSTQPSRLQAQWVLLTVEPPVSFSSFSQSYPKNMGSLTHCWLLKKEVTDSRKMVKWVLFLCFLFFGMWSHYVAEAGFELWDPSVSACSMLGTEEACVTTLGLFTLLNSLGYIVMMSLSKLLKKDFLTSSKYNCIKIYSVQYDVIYSGLSTKFTIQLSKFSQTVYRWLPSGSLFFLL